MTLLRRLWTLPLLAGAGGAALICGCDSSAKQAPRSVVVPSVRPVELPVPPAAHVQVQPAEQLPAVAAHRAAGTVTNVFAATSWQPTPAPLPPPTVTPSLAPVSTAAPTAPPMPFRFIGRYGDADSQIVMLVKDDRLYLVAVGETIDNAYRIERVSGSMVELTYLPLKLKQSLSTGGAG